MNDSTLAFLVAWAGPPLLYGALLAVGLLLRRLAVWAGWVDEGDTI